MRRGIGSWLVVLLVGFCLGVCVVCIGIPMLNKTDTKETMAVESTVDEVIEEDNFVLTITHLEDVLQPACDLITTKYYYTDADTYENYKEVFGYKLPFATDKVVFTYSGVISIGVKLSEVVYDINNEQQTITIDLPEVGILSNEIDADSFEYPYVYDSILNSTQMKDYTQLIGTLKEQKAAEISQNTQLQKEAMEATKQVLKQFLTVSDMTKEYTVIFK